MALRPASISKLTKGQIDYACNWWADLLPEKYDAAARSKYKDSLAVWLSGRLESSFGLWPVPGHISTYLVTTDSPLFQCACTAEIDVRDLPVSQSMLFLVDGNIAIAHYARPPWWLTVKIANAECSDSGVVE